MAPPVQRVKAAMGQLLSWRLVLTNRSKLPVAGARISIMLPDVPERKGSRAALCDAAWTCQHTLYSGIDSSCHRCHLDI